MFVNAGPIFGRAVAGYERARDRGLSDREMGAMDALESVVFSVAALEGFINEAAELASHSVPPELGGTPQSIATFAALLLEAEKSRAGLGLKFQLARQSLLGETYDVSRLPYQDFALLVDLRNVLIHYRSLETFEPNPGGIPTFNPARILDRLRAKNVTAEFEGEDEVQSQVITSWLNRISTIAVARWSCRTASAMVISVLDALPECYFRDQMESLYRTPFSAP